MTCHLAQLNTARMRFALDDPRMADFMAQLDPVNALADASPGFVWRLQSESGNATDIRATDDPHRLVNTSVWTSLEALLAFVRSPAHLALLKRRGDWFEPDQRPTLVLWWVPAGHRPDLDEALARPERLRAEGPGPQAFGFRQPHAPPEAAA